MHILNTLQFTTVFGAVVCDEQSMRALTWRLPGNQRRSHGHGHAPMTCCSDLLIALCSLRTCCCVRAAMPPILHGTDLRHTITVNRSQPVLPLHQHLQRSVSITRVYPSDICRLTASECNDLHRSSHGIFSVTSTAHSKSDGWSVSLTGSWLLPPLQA